MVLGVSSPKGSWGGVDDAALARELLPGFRPPREAGADDVAALASEVLLGVSSPKRSWGGINEAALASG